MARATEAKKQTAGLALYRSMLLIRRAEERLRVLFADGEVPGFIHLSIGQEAVAAGVASVLGPDDTLASTHRGHGHALARGMALDGFFLELMGRAGGICGGRGGSMHVADTSIGMLGANGIVGAGLSIAVGSALAHQVKGRQAVAVAFFGDGAMAEGALHESLNLAALWKLPLLLVCENNGWSEFSPTERQFAAKLAAVAGAFGVPCETVDGRDAETVAAAAKRLRGEILKRGGPRVLECRVHRFGGHFEGDPQKYRDPAQLAELGSHDPLTLAGTRLAKAGVGKAELARLATEVETEIEAAVNLARAAPPPSTDDIAGLVYESAP
jgi:acetoin:2,6-dichlorophenolindophenol oxidoreductase subunit alpha